MIGAGLIASSNVALAQDAPKTPKSGETLQGPKVPPAGLEGNRSFGKDGQMKGGQGQDGKGMQAGSRPMVMRAYMQAVQSLDLGEDQRASIEAMLADFRTRMQSFESEAAPKLKELQEARKNAPADQPIDPALKAKFQELEKGRPNFESFMKQVDGVLSDEQRGALKVKVDELKAKAAAEMKRRNEGGKPGGASDAKKPDGATQPSSPSAGGDGAGKSDSKDGSSGKKDGKDGKDGKNGKKSKKKNSDAKKDGGKDGGKDGKGGDQPAKDQPSDEPMNP